MILAKIYIRPSTITSIPQFDNKVAKALFNGVSNVSLSPLMLNGEYLVKYVDYVTMLEVYPDIVYSFEAGGEDEVMIEALKHLRTEVKAYKTIWSVVDVNIERVKVNNCDKFSLRINTPALLSDPYTKQRRKRFTNRPSVVFFTNVLDVTGLKRGDDRLNKVLNSLDSSLWEEPSVMKYKKVIYRGKEVIGITGEFVYNIYYKDNIIGRILEDAIARGIGSSRRNGFGRVTISCE